MKLTTWNVNSLRMRLPQLEAWYKTSTVDVVALQEIKLPDADFPHEAIQALGLHAVFSGQRTYNGVALLSKTAPQDASSGIPGFDDEQKRVLAATIDGVRVINVYVPNGQTVGSDKYQYKLRWFEALTAYVKAEVLRYPKLVVLGDFNIAPEDRDVHDPLAWQGSVHVSEPERTALQGLLALGLSDVFRNFTQPEQTYSWWDYRMLAFRRNHGLRIDLVLSSVAMTARCIACSVDKEPRRWERPSDHAPVTAEFA
jgi:exodeoxyribonuclease-3